MLRDVLLNIIYYNIKANTEKIIFSNYHSSKIIECGQCMPECIMQSTISSTLLYTDITHPSLETYYILLGILSRIFQFMLF